MFFCKYFQKHKLPVVDQNYITDVLSNIYFNYQPYLNGDDVIFLQEINAYAAFKYDVVADLLRLNEVAGVSNVHLALNNIYFSPTEAVHQQNKSTALKVLPFLSKREQYTTTPYLQSLLKAFFVNLPVQQSVDLMQYLVAPAFFISTLRDFSLLHLFPELDVINGTASTQNALQIIDRYFDDGDVLLKDITEKLAANSALLGTTKEMLQEISSHHPVNSSDIPKFLRSMIFASSESTIAFACTFASVYFNNYSFKIEEGSEDFLHLCNETARIYTPVPFIYRTIKTDTTYRGKLLKKGDLLVLFIGVANLDTKSFEHPTQIKFKRTNKHLAFGQGSYACIGRFAAFGKAFGLTKFLIEHQSDWQFTSTKLTHRIKNSTLKPQLQIVRKNG